MKFRVGDMMLKECIADTRKSKELIMAIYKRKEIHTEAEVEYQSLLLEQNTRKYPRSDKEEIE
jgi:hypothetical protein